MNKPATLVEYGVPIDAQTMVTPPDVSELELEAGAPRQNTDAGYIQRREGLVRPVPQAPSGTPWTAAHPVHHGGNAHLARGISQARRVAPQACLPNVSRSQARTQYHPHRDSAAAPLERTARSDHQHAPRPRGRGAAVSDLLRIHRRARLSRDAVHPPRFASGVHAGAGHDPRLPWPCAAADEPRDYAELLTLVGKAVASATRGDHVLPLETASAGSASNSV